MATPEPPFGLVALLALQKKSYMHEVLNEVYLQTFLRLGVTFRDESNDDN